MKDQFWIAFMAALIMAGGLGGVFYLAVKQNAAIGNSTIKFLTIVFILPLILIFGVSNVLRGDTIGPLIGVIIGFVLGWFKNELQ